jgi:hypothetical protein
MERSIQVNNEQFTYWLKGVLDASGQHPTSATIDMIKTNLSETMSDDNQPIPRPLSSFTKTSLATTSSPIMNYSRGSDYDIDRSLTGYENSLLSTGKKNIGLIVEDPNGNG